jgi:hypothetical protein
LNYAVIKLAGSKFPLDDHVERIGVTAEIVRPIDGLVARNYLEKVERLATSEKTTIVIARDHDSKMRVSSGFARDRVLEVCNVDGRLHVGAEAAAPRISFVLSYFGR